MPYYAVDNGTWKKKYSLLSLPSGMHFPLIVDYFTFHNNHAEKVLCIEYFAKPFLLTP
jgi:hypothetical protein